ncbi:MAG: hypothetical protein ACI9EP_001521 [Oceanospirillaceae bacterium]|jgi:hypothetical protein
MIKDGPARLCRIRTGHQLEFYEFFKRCIKKKKTFLLRIMLGLSMYTWPIHLDVIMDIKATLSEEVYLSTVLGNQLTS